MAIPKGRENKRNGTCVTSIDVAALAGVSQAAVSRAFTPGAPIAADTRKRILEAAQKLKYVPNSIASSLTTRRTNMVAVILGNMNNPFYMKVFKCLAARLQAQGRQILTFTVDTGASSDDALMRVLRYQVDGIILTSAQLSTRMTALCHERGIPLVLLNRYVPSAETPSVCSDNSGGGRMIAEAFLRAGARRFAVVKGDPFGTTSQDRLSGFLAGLFEAGITRNHILELEGNAVYEGARNAVFQAFRDGNQPVPDAIFGINDAMAMGVMDALRGMLNICVPEDVMVAGFDDIEEGARWPYRLTTVRQPVETMVDKAIALLKLDTKPGAVDTGICIDHKIPCQLIWRDTVRLTEQN